MEQLTEEWKLYELFYRYHYYKDDLLRIEKKTYIENQIIDLHKSLYKKKILLKDFKKLSDKLVKFSNDFKHVELGKIPLLGPFGRVAFRNNGYVVNLDDIQEVFVNKHNFSGIFNSKICGWIGWQLVKGDKGHLSSKYVYLTTKNNHNYKSALKNLIDKNLKYNQETTGRKLKRFFINNRFWFHDDLENLFEELPHTNELVDQMYKFNEWDNI